MNASGLGELYRSEARDHLARLGRAVLAIERGEGRGAVDEAFRCAHTLKGMSAAMGYGSVVAVAHGLEHLLEGLRAETLRVDPQVIDLIFRGVDELDRATETVLSGEAEGADSQSSDEGGDHERSAGGARERADDSVEGAASDPGRYVKVEQKRIDSLMDRAGELIVARERLVRLARAAGDRELERLATELARPLSELREDALRLRLAPLAELRDRLQRLVRDVSRTLAKQVDFQLVGAEVEIDRGLLGDVSDLLTHLLRNAIDHGIEPAEERERLGKSRTGAIRVTAVESRDSVVIRVKDDGRGVDASRVLAQAVEKGLRSPESPALSDSEVLELLVMPGFSTSAAVTELSGRGVGLDHVASRLKELGGELRSSGVHGAGATFTVVLPKTLSLTRVLLTGCGGEQLGIPLGAVERLEDEAEDWDGPQFGEGGATSESRAIMDLAELCGYAASVPRTARGYIVVIGRGPREIKVRVDALFGFQDVVVKRFPLPKGTRDVFAGATILSDGRPRLVLDPARLAAQARRLRISEAGFVNH